MIVSEAEAVKESPCSADRTGPRMNFSQHRAILDYYTYNLFRPILVLFHPSLSLSKESDVTWVSIRKV